MNRVWAGIDAGKGHHHRFAIDGEGTKLLSRRVANDEPDLLQLITDVLALGDEVIWAIDLADGGAALVIALLLNHEQESRYIPGRTVNRATAGYRGEGRLMPVTHTSSPTKPACAAICRRSGPLTKPSSSSVCSPAAAPIWSATAPEPSTACVAS